MSEPFRELWELLEREQHAARNADVNALMDLQLSKRQIISSMAANDVTPPQREALTERAAANVVLIRQLVGLLRGAAGVQTSTYGRQGTAQRDADAPLLRGRG